DFLRQLKALAEGGSEPGLMKAAGRATPAGSNITYWFQQSDWEKLAQAWVESAAIDWRVLHRSVHGSLPLNRERLLPLYPFARRNFPLPPRLVQKTSALQPIRTRTAAIATLLNDHQIKNVPMLPGAISLALAADAIRGKDRDAHWKGFEQFLWLAPICDAQFDIHSREEADGRTTFEVVSAGKVCARGRMRHEELPARPNEVGL